MSKQPTRSRDRASAQAADQGQAVATEIDAPAAGRVLPVDIATVMRSSFGEYATAVVVGRAIPDVRDGLKPVHRRILFIMAQEGYDWRSVYRKSARIVGSVMGRVHPHGVMPTPSQHPPPLAATAPTCHAPARRPSTHQGGHPEHTKRGRLSILRGRGPPTR